VVCEGRRGFEGKVVVGGRERMSHSTAVLWNIYGKVMSLCSTTLNAAKHILRCPTDSYELEIE
jgi:hypothetical protein